MAEDSIDVIIDGKVFATLIRDRPPEKQIKRSRKQKQQGGDEERFEDMDKGHKLHAHSDDNTVHMAYFLGSSRAKVSIPDHTRPGSYQKFLRGLLYSEIEGIFQASGRLLDAIDEYNEEKKKDSK